MLLINKTILLPSDQISFEIIAFTEQLSNYPLQLANSTDRLKYNLKDK